METVPYRRSKLLVKTIPKGTLLFRLVKNSEDDVRGVKIGDDKRCITPNYNVFFYPNPFMGRVTLEKWLRDYKDMYVYILEKDVKVLNLLQPSKYSRNQKTKRRTFLKRCVDVPKGCLPRKQPAYDPCFSESMIKNHPDVVGIIGIDGADAYRLQRKLGRKTIKNNLKYIQFATDSDGNTGPPELVLHPLTKRPDKDVIVSPSDKLENNYKLFKKFKVDDERGLRNFMDKHAVYNPETYYYVHKE